MANLTLSALFDEIYQLETTDPVLGGASGISNLQAKKLGNRTKWLRDTLEASGLVSNAIDFSGNIATLSTPGFYVITPAATGGIGGFGFLLVIARTAVTGLTGNYYGHYFIANTGKTYVRTYNNGSPITAWIEKLNATEYTNFSTVFVSSVQLFGTNDARSGWLKCDGSEVSRTTYAALFAIIGTDFGSGDGVNTFDLPNLADVNGLTHFIKT